MVLMDVVLTSLMDVALKGMKLIYVVLRKEVAVLKQQRILKGVVECVRAIVNVLKSKRPHRRNPLLFTLFKTSMFSSLL